MNKTFCDLCKEEIEHYGDGFHLKIEPRSHGKETTYQYHEVCNKCVETIKLTLINLKK